MNHPEVWAHQSVPRTQQVSRPCGRDMLAWQDPQNWMKDSMAVEEGLWGEGTEVLEPGPGYRTREPLENCRATTPSARTGYEESTVDLTHVSQRPLWLPCTRQMAAARTPSILSVQPSYIKRTRGLIEINTFV